MKRNMKQWVADLIAAPVKKPLPILSFPGVHLLDISVRDLVVDSDLQAKTMKAVADRVLSAAAVSLMDLSVEAECFGSTIRFNDNEVPTVVGAVVTDEDEAKALRVPEVGSARSGVYVNAVAKAVELIVDRPVFAGVLGPFSLVGRLLDVSEAMMMCYDEPEIVHIVLDKAVQFTIAYCNAYKAAGANGVMIAEPLAGLLSPDHAAEFSHPYVKRIVDAVQDDEFAVIYHNCGDNVALMQDGIYQIGAMGYHFGDAVRMVDMLPEAPPNVPVMGNVSPSRELCNGTPETVREATLTVMKECTGYSNYVISSGCDVPPQSPWRNIDAFFAAASEFYGQ